MEPIRVVVWDSIGNVLLGARPWERWPPATRARLLAEDPEAVAHASSFDQLFRGYDVELAWLHDPARSASGFRELFAEHAAILRDASSGETVAETIRDADYLVVHKEEVPAEALRGARRLRLVQHLGQDARGVPLDVAREGGIPVAAVPLTNYLAVAEHAWALILSALKRLPAQRALLQGREYRESWGSVPGQRFARGATLGLVGFGEIARPLARVARAFEMRTVYWDGRRFPELEAEYGVEYAEWEALFRESDVLSVQLALNERTRGIIGARELGWLKPHALFVNTARGRLVDQAALVEALAARRLGGAALDVYAEEPLPPGDPLHRLHEDLEYNVTLTPHSASLAPWTWVHDSLAIWSNVLRHLRGEPIEHLV